jgi:tetratricopeptide (TPR) repeat protein
MAFRNICILTFVFTSLKSLSQDPDSLFQQISAMPDDTAKSALLCRSGYSLRHNDAQLSYEYAKAAERASQNCGSGKYLADSYNLLGILHYQKEDFRKALSYHHRALKLREALHDEVAAAVSRINLGNVYTDMKRFGVAETNYLTALEKLQQAEQKERLCRCLINLGALMQHQKKNAVAESYYATASQMASELNSYELRSICLNNLAIVYSDNGNYGHAIAMNEDALKIRRLMDNTMECADSYINLGHNYLMLHNYAQAQQCIDAAMDISRRFEYTEAIRECYGVAAELSAQQGNFRNAYLWNKKYQLLGDSLRNEADHASDFTEISVDEERVGSSGKFRNTWMLLILAGLVIGVPYTLVKYLR